MEKVHQFHAIQHRTSKYIPPPSLSDPLPRPLPYPTPRPLTNQRTAVGALPAPPLLSLPLPIGSSGLIAAENAKMLKANYFIG